MSWSGPQGPVGPPGIHHMMTDPVKPHYQKYNVVAQCDDCKERGVTTLILISGLTTTPHPDTPLKHGNSIGIGGKGSCPNCPQGPGTQVCTIIAFAPVSTVLTWEEHRP